MNKRIIACISAAVVVVAAVVITLVAVRRGGAQRASSAAPAAVLSVSASSVSPSGSAVSQASIAAAGSASSSPEITTASQSLKVSSSVASVSAVYKSAQYGLQIKFSPYWSGYTLISGSWQSKTGQKGPLLTFRNMKWTSSAPTTDIPLEIFTAQQWDQMQDLKFHVGGSESYPLEFKRNAKYVFAIDSRWAMSAQNDYSNVRAMLSSSGAFTVSGMGNLSVSEAQHIIAEATREANDAPLTLLNGKQQANQTYSGRSCYTFVVSKEQSMYNAGTYLVGVTDGTVFYQSLTKNGFEQIYPHHY